MSSTHKHSATGKLALAGDIDDRLVALTARVVALENAAKPPTTPPPSTTVTVTSLAALASALANDANTDITLAAGTYTGDFWSDSRFAARTKPVTVRCSGVILQGRLTFRAGAHDQDWRGLAFANVVISQTGLIVFGGYAGEPGPHHISLRDFTVQSSVHRATAGSTTDHTVYFSYSVGGAHDILIENLHVTATDSMAIASGIHMDHGYAGDAPNVNAWNVTVRGLRFTGNAAIAAQQAVILWQPPVHDWVFEDCQITNSGGSAVRFESIGAQRISFTNVVSTGTPNARGFYSSMGTNPPGVVFGPGNSFG